MRKILIVDTLYTLMLYALLVEEWESSLFLLGSNLKKIHDVNIQEKYFFSKNLNLKDIYFILKLNLKSKKNIIYGQSQIFLNLFLRKKNFIELEDGLLNYTKKKYKKNIRYYLRKIVNRNFEVPGDKKYIKKIYLTGRAPILKEVKYKVEIIDLKKLWNKKTIVNQNKILKLFAFEENIKEKIKNKDFILFTQPLSEDGIISEVEKVELYRRIVKKYPKERLIIKSHPREKTKYKEIFEEYIVLDNQFPFEILTFLDIKFTKAITIFSTAALGLGENTQIDFYGTEVNEKIFKKFGSCENIMKRNAYIER